MTRTSTDSEATGVSPPPLATEVVVVGGGNVGYYLVKDLQAAGHEVLLLEKDRARAARLMEELGALVRQGDGGVLEIEVGPAGEVGELPGVLHRVEKFGSSRGVLAVLQVGEAFIPQQESLARGCHAEDDVAHAVARVVEQPRDAQRRARRHRHLRRVDHREHALAREHEAGASETREMGDRRDHNFQPECSATTPPVSFS